MDNQPKTAPSMVKENRIIKWAYWVWAAGFIVYILFKIIPTDLDADVTFNPRDHNTFYETKRNVLYGFLPRGPGQGGDNSGTLYLINKSGNIVNSWNLPMVQMGRGIINGNSNGYY